MLLGLGPEVVVTPFRFAPGSLWVQDVPTCSCSKSPWSWNREGLDVSDGFRQGQAALSSARPWQRGCSHLLVDG